LYPNAILKSNARRRGAGFHPPPKRRGFSPTFDKTYAAPELQNTDGVLFGNVTAYSSCFRRTFFQGFSLV